MHIGTHFFAGWLVSTTQPGLTRRERAAIALAGVAPDLDGLGIVADWLTRNSARPTSWYGDWHHVLGHNLGFALVVAAAAAAVATRRVAVAVLAFVSFHLHLLFDLAGSRGADGYQWPIPYLAPFSDRLQLAWSGQWMLSSWQNTAVTTVVVFGCVYAAWRVGCSPVGIFSSRADVAFVEALRGRFGAPRLGSTSGRR